MAEGVESRAVACSCTSYSFQSFVLTLSLWEVAFNIATMHSVTERQTYRQHHVTDSTVIPIADQLRALQYERLTRCRAIAGRTARCRYKFRHNGIVHAVTVVQHGFLV